MKKYLVLGALFLPLVCSVLIYMFYKKQDVSENEVMGETNNPEVEKLVSYPQKEVSAFIFNIQEDEHNHKLYINLTPFLKIDVGEQKITKFSIGNFEGDCRIGRVILVHPTDLDTNIAGRNFLFQESVAGIDSSDIKSQGNTIEYSVVEEVTQYNEVNNGGVLTPYFGIIIKEIGNVDYKAIKERDGEFDASRYLEYSEISLSSLNTDIRFDVYIEFEDGNKYRKTVRGNLSGELFRDDTAPMFTLETD